MEVMGDEEPKRRWPQRRRGRAMAPRRVPDRATSRLRIGRRRLRAGIGVAAGDRLIAAGGPVEDPESIARAGHIIAAEGPTCIPDQEIVSDELGTWPAKPESSSVVVACVVREPAACVAFEPFCAPSVALIRSFHTRPDAPLISKRRETPFIVAGPGVDRLDLRRARRIFEINGEIPIGCHLGPKDVFQLLAGRGLLIARIAEGHE